MLIHLDSCYSHVFVDYLWKIWCKVQHASLQRYRALKDWCLQCTKATLLRCWNDAWHGSAQRTAMAKNGLFFDMSRSTWKCFLGQEFAAPEKKTLRIQSEKSWKLGKRKPLLDCGWISRILWTVSTSGNWNWICIILFCSVGQAQRI